MSYAGRWARLGCVAAAFGVGLAVLEWSLPVALVCLLTIAVCAAGLLAVLALDPVTTSGQGHLPRRVLVPALAIGGGVLALLALATASVPLLLLVLVLVVLTSPPLVELVRRAGGRRPGVGPTPPRDESPADRGAPPEPTTGSKGRRSRTWTTNGCAPCGGRRSGGCATSAPRPSCSPR